MFQQIPINRGFWLILALVASAMALLVIGLPYSTRNFRLLVNALHAPAFAVLAIAIFRWTLGFMHRDKAVAVTLLVCTLIGLSSEILQLLGPRDADVVDLMNDVIGAVAGVSLWWVFAMRTKAGWKGITLPATLLLLPLLTWTLAPAAWYGYAAIAQQRAMPELLSFDHHWETTLFEASYDARLELEQAPDNWPVESSRLVRIVATGSYYPGITIQPTANWEGYRALSFYAASANDLSVRLTISIYDDDPNRDFRNRFNYSFTVNDLAQRITIPLADVRAAPRGREMNMAAIKEIVIFVGDASGSEAVFLDEFQLSQ